MEMCMAAPEMMGSHKTNRLIVIEWVTTMGVFVSCFAFLFYRIEKQNERTDSLYRTFSEESKLQSERADRQSQRSDKLYEMFIELVKEKNT